MFVITMQESLKVKFLLNEPGYNEGAGPGCAAEYLLAQSDGLFHVQFDVFGPYQLDCHAKNTDISGNNHGHTEIQLATAQFFEANPDIDYAPYDWDGDGEVEQFLYICAGPGANEGHAYFIWPNTVQNVNLIEGTPDGYGINQVSITPEATYTTKSHKGASGFGTFMHEYSHTLGLTDVYPTSGENVNTIYSVADTWDLMDGGNFVNYGWCPPNYTAFEKIYMHWLTPVELDSDTTITDMKPVSDGGKAYLIRHTENEYLLLENRQQTGWDYGAPGKGLTIWHVDFDQNAWLRNRVNNGPLRLDLYHADNMTFKDWQNLTTTTGTSVIALSPRMRFRWLSTSPYPWSTDSTTWVNDELSEESTPALEMNNPNAQGSYSLGKRITHIQMAADGSISFALETDGNIPSRINETDATDQSVRKVLKNGVLYIIRDGKTYSIFGSEM